MHLREQYKITTLLQIIRAQEYIQYDSHDHGQEVMDNKTNGQSPKRIIVGESETTRIKTTISSSSPRLSLSQCFVYIKHEARP